MKSLQSISARLDRIEEKLKPPAPPMQWRFVRYFAPMDMPEAEEEAARAAAIAEEEAKNGPISENDSIFWLIRIVNAPRQQAQTDTQAESIAGPPQDAPETQTAPEAMQNTANGSQPEGR